MTLPDGNVVMPDPVLVGRNEEKLRALADKYGIQRVSTNLDQALDNANDPIYFDATLTNLRADNVRKAIAKGKHVYCEKPLAISHATEALDPARLAEARV